MKTHIFITLLTSLLLTSSCVQSPKDQRVVAEGAQPILLSNAFTFTEGPATDKQGNVYFTDQPNNQIIKWTQEDNSFSVFTDSSHRSNEIGRASCRERGEIARSVATAEVLQCK